MKTRDSSFTFSFALSIALSCVSALPSFAKAEMSTSEQTTAAQKPEEQKLLEQKSATEKRGDNHFAEGYVSTTINAPADRVWGTLIDFSSYPKVFSKIESATVQKREGSLVYVESVLKKQMFVKNTVQHVTNDLSGKPGILKWEMTDGNFKHLDGEWTITPESNDTCKIRYRLAIDAGPVVPAGLVSIALHFFQHEIVNDLKSYVEKSYTVSLRKAQQGLSMSKDLPED